MRFPRVVCSGLSHMQDKKVSIDEYTQKFKKYSTTLLFHGISCFGINCSQSAHRAPYVVESSLPQADFAIVSCRRKNGPTSAKDVGSVLIHVEDSRQFPHPVMFHSTRPTFALMVKAIIS